MAVGNGSVRGTIQAEVSRNPNLKLKYCYRKRKSLISILIHSFGGLQPQAMLSWHPSVLSNTLRTQLREHAAQTLEPPTTTDNAGSEVRAVSRWSAPAWATESAVRSGVSKGRECRSSRARDTVVKPMVAGLGLSYRFIPRPLNILHYYILFVLYRYRGPEPSIWRQLQWSALCVSFCLHGKDLLFLHLGWTHRWTALVLNNLRLSERPAVLFLHWEKW